MVKITLKFFVVFVVQNLCFAQISTFSGTPTNFGSVSPVNNYPSAFSAVPAPSGGFGQPTFSSTQGNAFSPSAASASSSAGFFQPSTNPSSLDIFINKFTNTVHSSPLLADAFDISQTSPQAFANFLYHAINAHSMSNGISNPQDLATFVSQPLTENFKVLTYPMLVKINANAMGKHLLAEGILNDMNAALLALSFANEMENSAKKSVQKDFHESKFNALSEGYVNFLKSQGLYTREKLPVVGKYFGNEIRLARASSS